MLPLMAALGVFPVAVMLVGVDVKLDDANTPEGQDGQEPGNHCGIDQSLAAVSAFMANFVGLRFRGAAFFTIPAVNPFHGLKLG